MADKTIFLLDLDDTLLDSRRIMEDFRSFLGETIGGRNAKRYWGLVERLRKRCGCEDYLGAIQRYRSDYPRDQEMVNLSRFLLEYPYRKRLVPGARKVISQLRRKGHEVAIFSEGETLFQALKIERSGIWDAANGLILIYVHKDRQLADVAARFKGKHYVVVDDQEHLLASIKRQWRSKVTTILIGADRKKISSEAVDIHIERLAQLLERDLLTKQRKR